MKLLRSFSTALKIDKTLIKLKERNFFQSVFPDTSEIQLQHYLNKARPGCLYCGFDPTADSLHIGHLIPLLALFHCRTAGHHCIALVGGASSLVGDPTGRFFDRPPLSRETVNENTLSIEKQIHKLLLSYQNLVSSGATIKQQDLTILNNAEWLEGINLIDFLMDIGRHFRIGPMLSKESVKNRMDSYKGGMNFTEFTYQIFQAYDWLHLFEKYGCHIQIGGNDQLGNMNAGYQLIKKKLSAEVFALTVPLITTLNGNKLGKSSDNAVWLNENKTGPFELYQFFINLPDADVKSYLNLLTLLPANEIEDVMKQQNLKPESRIAQKKVAEQVTLLVHGESGVQVAKRYTQCLIGQDLKSLHTLSQSDLLTLFKNAPCCDLLEDPEMTILDMGLKAGCFASRDEAERVIGDGGFQINFQKIRNPNHVVTHDFILPANITLLRIGKRANFHVVRWN